MMPDDHAVARSGLLGTNEVFVTDVVVSGDEQAALLDWVEGQYRAGKLLLNPHDAGAYSTPFRATTGTLTRLTGGPARDRTGEQTLVWVPAVDDEQVDRLPAEFWRIRKRVIDLLDIDELEEDHYKGAFMSYIAPGTGVHQHRDDRLMIDGEEVMILRCNVLFCRPENGGLPVVGSTEIEVLDRGMWAFWPTEFVHSATPVQGLRFRGVLSFGFLARAAQHWRRRFRLSSSFAREYGLEASPEVRDALLDQLRQASQAQALGRDQFELFEYVLRSAADFSVEEAAGSLGHAPADAWSAIRALQCSGVLESMSSVYLGPERVFVL